MAIACTTHPGQAALYRCESCRRFLCEACADVRQIGTTRLEQCRGCGKLVRPIPASHGVAAAGIAADVGVLERPDAPLTERLAAAPKFLWRTSTLVLLA